MSQTFLRASLMVTALHALNFGLSIFLQGLLARATGADTHLDSLYLALSIATYASLMVMSSVSYVVIPKIATMNDSAVSVRYKQSIFSMVVAITMILGACIYFNTELFSKLFGGSKSQLLVSSIDFEIKRCVFYLLPLNISILLSSFRSAEGSYFRVSMGAILSTVSSALSVLLLRDHFESQNVVFYSNILGSTVQLLTYFRKCDWSFNIAAGLGVLKDDVRVFGMAFVANLFGQVSVILNRGLMTHLPEGAISQLQYAERVYQAVVTLATTSLAVVGLTKLAQFEKEGDLFFEKRIQFLLYHLLFISAFVAVGTYFCAPWILQSLLVGGKFTNEDAHHVIAMMVAYLPLIFISISTFPLSQVLFVKRAFGLVMMIWIAVGVSHGASAYLYWNDLNQENVVMLNLVPRLVAFILVIFCFRHLKVKVFILDHFLVFVGLMFWAATAYSVAILMELDRSSWMTSSSYFVSITLIGLLPFWILIRRRWEKF